MLWSPREVDNMYLIGDKSQVVDIDNPNMDVFPRYLVTGHHHDDEHVEYNVLL